MNLIKVEVLGTGCRKCQQLAGHAKTAIAALNLQAEVVHIEVVHITDPIEIAQRGVMSTPALAVNGKVVSQGKVLSSEAIQLLLSQPLSSQPCLSN